MNPQISVITLGVQEMARAKQFYGEGLGWPLAQDFPQWVSFKLGDGSQLLALYAREALAGDADVPAQGSRFRGSTFNYVVKSEDRVAAVIAEA
jgi:catechol 2,3-dioxygenase-like lactoylglutathione lyase family enzyme